jgi:hypothetical protein
VNGILNEETRRRKRREGEKEEAGKGRKREKKEEYCGNYPSASYSRILSPPQAPILWRFIQ